MPKQRAKQIPEHFEHFSGLWRVKERGSVTLVVTFSQDFFIFDEEGVEMIYFG